MIEELLSQTFDTISPLTFFLNLLVTTVLVGLLAIFYTFFGNAVSNRRRFAMNFLPLALTTLLIITVVKSSIALSLGLVGALSIVRFRSAIKDPEELTYLFFTIAIGLAAGANQLVIAVTAFVVIVLILLAQALINGKFISGRTKENMYLNISTSHKDLGAITDALSGIFSYLELKRVDETQDRLNVSFVVGSSNMGQIEKARNELMAFSPDTRISFIEQRNIVA